MRNMAALNTVRTLGLVLLVVGVAGCGEKGARLSPVSGKVTFQGKPVAKGMIRFSSPQAAIDILANLQSDGTYSVRMARGAGLPKGTYKVAIMPPQASAPVGTMTLPPPPSCPDIPEKYRNPSTSGLTLTVKAGGSPFDIDMQPDK